jgi:iron complex transport system substrate-binding protein
MKCLYALLLFLLAVGVCGAEPVKKPERILSLSAAATHIMTRLGSPPAAIDEYGKIAAGKNMPPVIGKGSAVSQEKIVDLNIDAAIIWYYQVALAKVLQTKGIRVETVGSTRLSGYPGLIRQIGKLTGRHPEAEKLAAEFKTKLKTVAANSTSKPVRVYFELYSEGKCSGDQTYLGDLVRAAGGQNIVDKNGLISLETVIEKSPEVIFYIEGFGKPKEIAARPGISSTPAAKNKRIYPVNRRLVVEGLAPLEAIKYFKSHMR